MIIDMLKILLPIVASVLISLITTKKAIKTGLKASAPKLNTFVLDNDEVVDLYLSKITASTYVYSLEMIPERVYDSSNKTTVNFNPIFKAMNISESNIYLKKHKCFGMCFRNDAVNTVLCLDRMKGHTDCAYNITDKTQLSLLENGISVCIICDLSCYPKSFQGKYENSRVAYRITQPKTSSIVPMVETISG